MVQAQQVHGGSGGSGGGMLAKQLNYQLVEQVIHSCKSLKVIMVAAQIQAQVKGSGGGGGGGWRW